MRAIFPFAGAPSVKGGNSPNAKCENRWGDRDCADKIRKRPGFCKDQPNKSPQWNKDSKNMREMCKKACGLPPCPKRTQQPKRQSPTKKPANRPSGASRNPPKHTTKRPGTGRRNQKQCKNKWKSSKNLAGYTCKEAKAKNWCSIRPQKMKIWCARTCNCQLKSGRVVAGRRRRPRG